MLDLEVLTYPSNAQAGFGSDRGASLVKLGLVAPGRGRSRPLGSWVCRRARCAPTCRAVEGSDPSPASHVLVDDPFPRSPSAGQVGVTRVVQQHVGNLQRRLLNAMGNLGETACSRRPGQSTGGRVRTTDGAAFPPPSNNQCEGSSPVSRPWRSALASLSPAISTALPLRSYLVVMASRAATVEASQMWESERSMTTRSGSSA